MALGLPRSNAPKRAGSSPSDIDLLLLGKTGNGKSATGNSILGNKIFTSKSSSSSVTKDIQHGVARHYDGRIIKVVDGPGVGDTRMSSSAAMETVMKSMDYAITCNPRGYHAFLLVVRFGGRFTEEDNDTIVFLKKIFGNDFVSKFCILVMTCGDNFSKESKETGQTFDRWCTEQDGVLKLLMSECNNRVILFNNSTSNAEKKQIQTKELISMVDQLTTSGHRYTDANFEMSKKARERLMIEAKEPFIREEIMIDVDLIMQELNTLKNLEPEKKLEPLEDLYSWAAKVYEKIKAEDNGTGVLHKLAATVNSLLYSLNEEKTLSRGMIQTKEEMDLKLREKELEMKEQMRQQQEEYQRQLKAGNIREEEQQRLLKEMEETRRRNEEQYEKQRKEQEALMKKQNEGLQKAIRQYAALQEECREIKKENDRGIFSRILSGVTYPFRKLKELIWD